MVAVPILLHRVPGRGHGTLYSTTVIAVVVVVTVVIVSVVVVAVLRGSRLRTSLRTAPHPPPHVVTKPEQIAFYTRFTIPYVVLVVHSNPLTRRSAVRGSCRSGRVPNSFAPIMRRPPPNSRSVRRQASLQRSATRRICPVHGPPIGRKCTPNEKNVSF